MMWGEIAPRSGGSLTMTARAPAAGDAVVPVRRRRVPRHPHRCRRRVRSPDEGAGARRPHPVERERSRHGDPAHRRAVRDPASPRSTRSSPRNRAPTWVERLRNADVCAIEHLPPCAVFDTPQARHNEMVVVVDDPVLGRVEQVAPPAKFSRGPQAPSRDRRRPRATTPTEVLAEASASAVPSGAHGRGAASRRTAARGRERSSTWARSTPARTRRGCSPISAPTSSRSSRCAGDPLRGHGAAVLLRPGRETLDRREPEATPSSRPRSAGCSSGPTSCTTTCDPGAAERLGLGLRAGARREPVDRVPLRAGLGLERVPTRCGRASPR